MQQEQQPLKHQLETPYSQPETTQQKGSNETVSIKDSAISYEKNQTERMAKVLETARLERSIQEANKTIAELTTSLQVTYPTLLTHYTIHEM